MTSAWLEHAPFGFWIVSVTRPRRLVELGSHHGFSYLVFCQAVQRLGLDCNSYAVDTWTGDAHTGPYGNEVFATLHAYHEPRYAGFSSLIRERFDDALPHFEDGSIDLLHIDGQHRYEDVLHDFETWRPKLSDRAVVLFHDINVRRSDFGAARVWRELRQRFPGFAFHHGSGLGVLGVGADLPPVVRALLVSEGMAATAIAAAYSRLGAAITAQQKVDGQAAALQRLHATFDVNEQLRTGKSQDAQLITRLRAELVAAKGSEGRAVSVKTRLEAEIRRLVEENGKRDEIIRIIQGDAAGVRVVLAAREAELQAERRRGDTVESKLEAARQLHLQVQRLLRDEMEEKLGIAEQLQKDTRQTASQTEWHLNEHIRAQHAAIEQLSSELTRTDAELRSRIEDLAVIRNSLGWRLTRPLHRLHRFREQKPYGGALGRLRLAKDLRLLRASPLFDSVWYLQSYPDVAQAKLDPAVHFLLHGAEDRRDPGPAFSTESYLVRRPDVAALRLNPLVHFLRNGQREGASHDPLPPRTPVPATQPRTALPAEAPPPPALTTPVAQAETLPTAAEIVARAFPNCAPFPVFSAPASGRPRVTMVTDSVNADSLYGGVATGLVLSTLLAERLGGDLRVLTRVQADSPDLVREAMERNGVQFPGNIAFDYAPLGSTHHQVDVSADDRFVTTSWWTTRSMLRSVGPARITYLLQEDERMFYPHGDERLRCAELLAEARLQVVVNTQMLLDHLASTGLPELGRRAIAFEPAVPLLPASQPPDGELAGDRRLNFFFYARPNHARNLYLRGIEALGAAIEDGHIDPERWTVHFVGGGGGLTLPRGVKPVIHKRLSRARYGELVQRMDAALCLMYTPHPSYPPLDLAQCGATVVTNRYGPKVSLEHLSGNILCVEPDVASLAEAVGEATTLAAKRPGRATGGGTILQHDWREALSGVINQIARQ